MKKLFAILLMSAFAQLGYSQLVPKNIPASQTLQFAFEKIKIPFTQQPLMHTDGGWEKGPSAWASSSKYPVDYRAGLLFSNLGKNGVVQYLMVELRFKEAGSIQMTANSMDKSNSGTNGWVSLFGKKGETVKKPVIVKEPEFGTQVILFLKDFKPYKPMVVN